MGLITIKDILKVKQHPLATKDPKGRLVVGAAIGALRQPYERAKALMDAGVDFIVIDAAHGHSKGVMECVKMLKKKLPDLQVIAGNVATKEGVRDLHELGRRRLETRNRRRLDLHDPHRRRRRRAAIHRRHGLLRGSE